MSVGRNSIKLKQDTDITISVEWGLKFNSNQPTELLSRSDNNEVLVALRLEVLFCSILFCSMKTSIFVSHSTSGNFYRSRIPPSETI